MASRPIRFTLCIVTLVRLAAVFVLIDSAQVAISYCLRAFKDTRCAFIMLCLAYWLITLPWDTGAE